MMLVKILGGLGIGGALGAAMGYFGSCTSGACPLTASPWRGALFGSLLGFVFALSLCQGCGTASRKTGDAPAPPGGTGVGTVEIGSEADFREKVEASGSLVLADFYADWCGYCRKMEPVLARLSGDYDGKAVFVKVNVEGLPDLARRFRVEALPTLIIFRSGQPVETVTGYRDADALRGLLDRHLSGQGT